MRGLTVRAEGVAYVLPSCAGFPRPIDLRASELLSGLRQSHRQHRALKVAILVMGEVTKKVVD